MKSQASEVSSSRNLPLSGAENIAPPARQSSVPPSVPDHELLRSIGVGSYGEVWLARSAIGSLRAVKVVYRKSFDHDRPYEREFEGLKRFEPLSHARESQVDIFHVGRNDTAGFFYYIMELADAAEQVSSDQSSVISNQSPVSEPHTASGPSLNTDRRITDYSPRTLKHDLRTRGALPVAECVQIAHSLTRALEHLHAHGLVHRDIKPSNIIFVKGVPKLADIGLVTSVDATRSFVGTDGYIPPEGPGTPQADLYSLGKVLYECVTGKDRLDFPELPADWRTCPDFDQLLEFNEILTKACDSEPNRRYQTAGRMRTELESLQSGESVKRKRTTERRWAVGKKIAVAGMLLFVLTTGSTLLIRQIQRSDFAGDGPPSKIDDANTLCERAMLITRSDNYGAFLEAYTNFNQAIRMDPTFARAYAGLLELRWGREPIPSLGPMKPEELRTIVRKLRELAPDLAATHCAQSILSYRDLDFEQARASALKAIKADPNYELGHTTYGWMLLSWGWPIKAREQFTISHELTRSKMTVECFLANTYYFQRDYTNALSRHRKALRFDPLHSLLWQCIGEDYRAMGDYKNCIDNMEKADLLRGSAANKQYSELRRAVEERGARGYWEEWWARSEKNPSFENYWKAVYQLKLGDTNAALGLLNQSLRIRQERDGWVREFNLTWLLYHEFWDGIRDDPRFKELLDKVGFTKVMPARK